MSIYLKPTSDIFWSLVTSNHPYSPYPPSRFWENYDDLKYILQFYPGSRRGSKLGVPDTDDVKQKTSLFPVQGRICLVLFHGFCSFVLCQSVSGTRSHFPAAVRPATEQNYYGLDVSEGGNFKYSKALIAFFFGLSNFGDSGADI